MRLEKIHFKNLASLNGEWMLDLTDPVLRDAGIFAMAGPVGSGKTTVFDAVRLALFGRTSRLSRITRSENEIMTSGTDECFAEVVFSCPSGKYLCRWSQHRAKSGQLQNAKHFLAKFSDGSADAEILTSKLEETRERIRSVTGMDFNHFSRAVILPQGQFASFLQAGAEDRSPILEQITGTGIYAEISMKVFDIFRQIAQDLEIIKKNAENTELVPNEQIEEWEKMIAALKTDAAESLKKYNSLSELDLKRKNLEIERTALIHLKTELPAAEHDCRLARTALAAAEKELSDSKGSRDSLLPILKRIRELDSRIKMGREALDEFGSVIEQRESVKNADLKKLERETDLLQMKKSSFARIADFLEKKKEDSKLSSELSGLKNLCNTVVALLNETDDMRRKLSTEMDSESRKKKETENLLEKVTASGASLEELEKIIEKQKEDLAKLTGGSSLPEIFQQKEKVLNRKILLENMDSLRRREKDLETKLSGSKARSESAKTRIGSLEEQLSMQEKIGSQIEKMLHLSEQKRLMEAKIAAYEKDRKSLADGQKCPLCGSENHPYIEHRPVMTAEDDCAKYREELKNAERERSIMEQTLFEEKLARTKLENEISLLSEERERIGKQWGSLPWRELGDDRSGPIFHANLKEELEKNADQLKNLDSSLKQIELAEKEISSLEQNIIRMRETHSKLQLEWKGSATTLSNLHLQIEQEKVDLAEKEKISKEGSDSFRIRLSQFGIAGETSFSDAVILLEQRQQIYESQRAASGELEKEIIALQTFIAAETARLENEKNAVVLQKAEYAKRKQIQEQQEKTRRDEFGTKSPDSEEKRAEDAVGSAEDRRKKSAESSKKAEERLSMLHARVEDVQKRIENLEKYLTEADVLSIPSETLRRQIAELNCQRQEQDQRIGELSAKLEHASENRKHAAELFKRIEEKKKEYSKWEYLNSLIGSADGKKYRDFVQSLTLEKLIVNANDQLRHFTDRYTLISDRETGLDFDVIDSYRGNEIRSSRNLSGGETFLVSLALALGLSRMVHGAVRIDTLFLDEGFGTLDEDSLQHALEQLAGLRRTGKLIGIITHAHGIEDAVPVVLKFTNNGGYSTITGPGVEKISAAQ